jgi:hypothetical protein
MRKRLSFWTIMATTLGVWLSIIWIAQARQGNHPVAGETSPPLQQACSEPRADLRINSIEVNSRGIGQPFDVRVEISNGSTGTNGLADSWSYLYVDRTPSGAPDVQAFAPTTALADGGSISARFTVTSGYATVGWHTVAVVIDATNAVPNEACNGESNNQGATSFEIATVQPPTSTPRPPPTPTSFPPPAIYLFAPEEATIGRGDAVTLRWQVTGESVSVTLDGEPVPMEASVDKYPTESHVYTLRAENPGGAVQETSRITVAEPTITPTPTEVSCDYPTVHEFGASPSSVIRGERVTIYWDVEGAAEVFLNGEKVSDVSAKEFKLNRTTTFTLLARNGCGEVEEELTVQASYATATPTYTPTITRTPTRTSTPTATYQPTYTPTRTPTRNLLPTHTGTPSGGTATATATPTATGTSSAFDSPVGTPTGTVDTPTGTVDTPTGTVDTPTGTVDTPTGTVDTPTGTVDATPSVTMTGTLTVTATLIPASTDTPSPTWTATTLPTPVGTATPSPTSTVIQTAATIDLSGPVNSTTPTQTPDVGLSGPIASPTAIPPAGTIRMYLCPLAVLLIFAVGVVILSIVVPRIQERQQDLDDLSYSATLYGVTSSNNDERRRQQETLSPAADGATYDPDEPLPEDDHSPQGVPFDPDESLLDDERPPEGVSFDPLLDELAPSDGQETERAPSTSEEKT